MIIPNKSEFKLLTKMLLALSVILAPTLFSIIAVNFLPVYFTPISYAVFRFQEDYAENDDSYNRILIIGDSAAQASYMPSLLSEDTFNFSVGAETPVDGYYKLVKYLDNHDAPEYIFCSYNPREFYDQIGIWTNPIRMHGMSFDMAFQIMKDAENYSDDTNLKRDNYFLQLLAYHYGFHIDSVKTCFEALLNNLSGNSCFETYKSKYKWLTQHKGQDPTYTGGDSDDICNYPTDGDDGFPVTDMADVYMRRIFSLCKERGIRLIYETVPFNESSYQAISDEYMESYNDYWSSVAAEYPDAVVNGKISYYDNRYFSDNVHVNLDGCTKFSEYIREKYSYVFDGKQLNRQA